MLYYLRIGINLLSHPDPPVRAPSPMVHGIYGVYVPRAQPVLLALLCPRYQCCARVPPNMVAVYLVLTPRVSLCIRLRPDRK